MSHESLSTCSCLATETAEWIPAIAEMATNDSENLVRMRAAEYLGISGKGDPVPFLTTILGKSASDAEALLILNSMTALQDGPHSYRFPLA